MIRRSGHLRSIHLGYLGALSTQDGIQDLVRVLVGVRECGLDAKLTIIGDGDGRQELEEALAREGLSNYVTVTGWVRSDEVPGHLDPADICVDPAPATEVNNRSSMVKIAEYLALGKPVVAYDLLETRRTAADAAILVEPGNVQNFVEAVLRLGQDEALRTDLSKRAHIRATRLVWPHAERALLGVYARLLSVSAEAHSEETSSIDTR